jgi:hypothetical protein
MYKLRVGAGVIIVGVAATGASAFQPLAGELTSAAPEYELTSLDLAPEALDTPLFSDDELSLGLLQDTAPDALVPVAETEPYVGGRGHITTEGPTGMFLNPTSGTLAEGGIAAQYCLAFLRAPGGQTNIAHGFMVSYGVKDWLEVGAVGLLVNLDDDDHNIGVAGPFFRIRLVKDDPESWVPEFSVGAVGRFGYRALESQSIFLAASKGFPLDVDGFFRSFRLHAGFRQRWQDSSFGEANASIVYVGGEIEFPHNIFFVSEISTKDDLYVRTPFSFGVQFRHPKIALSLAGIQTGFEEQVSLYAGIGIDY